jgi:hypothetical protein
VDTGRLRKASSAIGPLQLIPLKIFRRKKRHGSYHIVATGDKAHIANLASVDIW